MARIRTIKPSFWKHEDLSALPEATHMLAAALLNYADDEGYFNANPGLIKGECFPLREPSVSIHDSLIHLSSVGFIRMGNGADGKRYGYIVTFGDHQIVNRKTLSKIKPMDIVWEHSVSPPTHLSEPSHPEGNKEGNKEEEGKGGEAAHAAALASPYVTHVDVEVNNGKRQRATRLAADWQPDQDDRRFARESGIGYAECEIEVGRFRDYWIAKPGKDGTKLDWSATWRNWCRRTAEDRGRRRPVNGGGTAAETLAAHRERDRNGILAALSGELGDRGGSAGGGDDGAGAVVVGADEF